MKDSIPNPSDEVLSLHLHVDDRRESALPCVTPRIRNTGVLGEKRRGSTEK